MILNARAANGSLSSALRSSSASASLLSGSVPVTGGMSSGDGRKSTTASSIGCTPLFLNAEPQMTGTNGAPSLRTDSMARLRSAALISSTVSASPPRYFSSSLSSASLTFSISFSR